MTIRKIVKDALKIYDVHLQFTDTDVADGLLETGSEAEVNKKYSDAYIIKEVRELLSRAEDEGWDGDADVEKSRQQLRRFLHKYA